MKALISDDAFARALGATAVAEALQEKGLEISKTGSYGLSWLEPLVEFETVNGRLGFGPLSASQIQNSDSDVHSSIERLYPESLLHEIANIPYLRKQTRLVCDRIGHVPPLADREFSEIENILDTEPSVLVDCVEKSGLRGRGGAGFPAHIKWRTVATTEADQKYIVCNADEGDSGTFADRLLMEGDPFRLIEGMVIAGYATGASQGVIYLRSEYPVSQEILQSAISKGYAIGLLGEQVLGSSFSFDLELFVGAGAYICGEETSLLESLEGKRGQIRTKPPVPAVAGLYNKPTLVHNVITLAAVPAIFRIGAENYRDIGVAPSTGTMTFQLAGNVKCGGLVELPFGLPLRALIEEFGQGTHSGRPLKAVQIGGPLGAYLSDRELDQPLTYERMAEIGAGIGHGGIVVFDDTIDLAEQAEYAFEFCEFESCGKCTPCRIGSVRGKELIQRIRRTGIQKADIVLVNELCDVMEKASLCQMGGMTPIPVRSAIERFQDDFIGPSS